MRSWSDRPSRTIASRPRSERANILGGGGATLPIDNPGNSFLQVSSLISEAIANLADSAIDRKAQCADLDDTIEGELRSCEAPRSIFRDTFGTARLWYMRDRTSLWVVEADKHQVDTCRARCFVEKFRTDDSANGKQKFEYLCNAYSELVGDPTDIECVDPNPTDDCEEGGAARAHETVKRRATLAQVH